jgi:quinoprotein glucose dehydrogenase
MPAFEAVLQGKEETVVAYLFEITTGRPSQRDADLNEIGANRMSVKDGETQDTSSIYLNVTPFSHFNDIENRPSIKPPWGELNAINLHTGEYAWKIPLGNNPDLQEKGAPETGLGGSGGPIVTAGGLVFIGSTRDRKFRAFDKHTGKLLWESSLPGVGNATPCTYMSNGKQYVAISVSGTQENPSGAIIAFALPD